MNTLFNTIPEFLFDLAKEQGIDGIIKIFLLFLAYNIIKKICEIIRGIDNTKLKKITLNLEVIKNTEELENKIKDKNISIFIKRQAIKTLFNKDCYYIKEDIFNQIITYSDLQRVVNTIKKCYYNLNINNLDTFEERKPILGDIWFRIKNKKALGCIAVSFAMLWTICAIITPPILISHVEINIPLSKLNTLLIQVFVIIIYSPLLCISYHALKRFQEIKAIEWLNENKPRGMATIQVLNNTNNDDLKNIKYINHKVKATSFLEKIKSLFK